MKYFDQKLMQKALKLHTRMLKHESLGTYNRESGADNKVELVKGEPKKIFLRFKVRIDLGYRKFFHKVKKDGSYLRIKDWDGDFYAVDTIFVTDVNNHDYKRK